MQMKKGIEESVRLTLVAEIDALAEATMTAGVVSPKVLTGIDRLMRRLYSDTDRGWVMWASYVERALFGGNRNLYSAWARDNCADAKE